MGMPNALIIECTKQKLTYLCSRKTAVVHLTQNLCPSVFPFVKMKVPAIVTLYFKETDEDSGLLKIYKEEDSWTLEGIR
jgi:hypothetical protein